MTFEGGFKLTTKKVETVEKSNKEKKCFIVTPIGGDRSEIRDALDGLLKNVLEPVLLESGFKHEDIIVAHQMKDSGSINTQLITRIIEDELCIVNLTGLNPNVMYELAIRHAVGKPVVIIAENGTKLPFDIVDQRTIFYHNTMLGAVQLKESLSDMIGAILSKPEQTPDNPIIKIIKENSILDKIKSDGKEHSELSLILNKISDLEDRVINTKKLNSTIDKKPIVSYSIWELEYEGNINTINLKDFWLPIRLVRQRNNKDKLNKSVLIEFPGDYPVSRNDIEEFVGFLTDQGLRVKTMSPIEV